jgi:hypothetical protein
LKNIVSVSTQSPVAGERERVGRKREDGEEEEGDEWVIGSLGCMCH